MKTVTWKKDHRLSHAENRLKLCLLYKGKKKKLFEITSTLEQLINTHFVYRSDDEHLPKSLCGNCKSKLYNKTGAQALTFPDCSDYYLYNTRSKSGELCYCKLCTVANDRSEFSFARKASNEFKIENGKAKQKSVNYKCADCLSIIGKGKQHVCTKETLVENLKSTLENLLNQRDKEQFAADVVMKKMNDQDSKNNNGTAKISRKNHKPITVTVGPQSSSNKTNGEHLISAKDMTKISTDFGLSSNTTLGIARSLRMSTRKKKLFEPNLKTEMQLLNHSLDSHFYVRKCQFFSSKKSQQSVCEEYIVLCRDVQKLIDDVKRSRGGKDVHLKFGADSGGGFLKITLSMQSFDNDFLNKKNPKRRSYDKTIGKEFKDSGVDKLLIIGLTEFSEENHENLSVLWDLLKLKHFKRSIAADLKLTNILVGLMSHSSTYQCTWCIASKENLDSVGELRTIGSCLTNCEAWKESGGKKENCKKFFNCSQKPIISSDRDQLIILI